MFLHPIHPDRWKALTHEIAEWQFSDGQQLRYRFFTQPCGELWLNSGRLVACDPATRLQWHDNAEVRIPPGRYPVVLTLADISEALDGSRLCEAYLSLIVCDQPATGWRFLAPAPPGITPPPLGRHEFIGIGSESGWVCLTDANAIERLMPDPAKTDWEWDLIDTGDEHGWISLAEDPDHIRAGTANILLPNATTGENLVLSHAGWGEGSYALVATHAADGTLTAVHIDLAVLPLPPLPEWD